MGNVLQVFNNEKFGEVRTVNLNGVYWFVGKDIADKLGYTNTRKALGDHVDLEDKMKSNGVTIRDSMGREQETVMINESGMYSLIIKSKLPMAKEFKRWVTSEILPSIRATGSYTTNSNNQYKDIIPFNMEVVNNIQTTSYLMATMQNQLVSSESRQEEIKNKTEYNLNEISTNTSNIISIMGLQSIHIKTISDQIKYRLSSILGYEIMATSKIYKVIAKKYLIQYNCIKWENVPLNMFSDICESIKDITLEDIENELLRTKKNNPKQVEKSKDKKQIEVKNKSKKKHTRTSNPKTRTVIAKGKEYVYDTIKPIPIIPEEHRLGSKNINTQGLEMEIIRYGSFKDIDIKFTSTGETINGVAYNNFRKGLIASKYNPSVRGVGYIGVGRFLVNYKGTQTTTYEYRTWVTMLGKCYGNKANGINTVCDEWLNFQTFGEWLDKERQGRKLYSRLKENKTEYNPNNCYMTPNIKG